MSLFYGSQKVCPVISIGKVSGYKFSLTYSGSGRLDYILNEELQSYCNLGSDSSGVLNLLEVQSISFTGNITGTITINGVAQDIVTGTNYTLVTDNDSAVITISS